MNTQFHESNPVPPGSKLKLLKWDENTPDWKTDIGRIFSVGFYNPTDGLDVVWLVNEKGEYEQTTDQESIALYFEILSITENKDIFGSNATHGM